MSWSPPREDPTIFRCSPASPSRPRPENIMFDMDLQLEYSPKTVKLIDFDTCHGTQGTCRRFCGVGPRWLIFLRLFVQQKDPRVSYILVSVYVNFMGVGWCAAVSLATTCHHGLHQEPMTRIARLNARCYEGISNQWYEELGRVSQWVGDRGSRGAPRAATLTYGLDSEFTLPRTTGNMVTSIGGLPTRPPRAHYSVSPVRSLLVINPCSPFIMLAVMIDQLLHMSRNYHSRPLATIGNRDGLKSVT